MRYRWAVAISAILFSSTTATGQTLTLQSPVFANFSVRTNISVPDRGSALLGSVSRAADSRKNIGWAPRGSSMGRSIEHRSVRSHVYIHDFAAMDPFLQNRDEVLRQIRARQIDPVKERQDRQSRAAKAYKKLADKAEKNGKDKLARWYREKAREYANKTQIADRPKSR